jgi:hypothetical protein
MRLDALIHNDEVTCFHLVVQRTQKVVVMGCHHFKDKALIKRRQACQKMNESSRKLKDENKQSNHWKLFLFTKGSYVFFGNFGVCRSMIEKL